MERRPAAWLKQHWRWLAAALVAAYLIAPVVSTRDGQWEIDSYSLNKRIVSVGPYGLEGIGPRPTNPTPRPGIWRW